MHDCSNFFKMVMHVILSYSFQTVVSGYLHIWVHHQGSESGVYLKFIHILARPLELVRLHSYCHSVSTYSMLHFAVQFNHLFCHFEKHCWKYNLQWKFYVIFKKKQLRESFISKKCFNFTHEWSYSPSGWCWTECFQYHFQKW